MFHPSSCSITAARLLLSVIVTDVLVFLLHVMRTIKFVQANKEPHPPIPRLHHPPPSFPPFPPRGHRKAQTLPTPLIPASDRRWTKGLLRTRAALANLIQPKNLTLLLLLPVCLDEEIRKQDNTMQETQGHRGKTLFVSGVG